jgi:predicted lipoprotein with Yx(FWY)xxD motif
MKAGTAIKLVVVSAVIAGCAAMGDAPARFSRGVLVNTAGMTLYTFDKDPVGSGKSVCNDKCAVNWPPLKAAAQDKPGGDFTIVTRDDGSKQWAYKGKPLYLWVKDQKPGDTSGDGVNNVWRAVHREHAPMPSSGY